MRCFLAVPVPEPVRHDIEDLLRRLRPRLPGARFVSTDVLHLTLHFFADLAPGQLDLVLASAREGCSATPAFDVSLAGLGVFPDHCRPRVLWIGVREGMAGLAGLHEAIAWQLRDRGIPLEDRPFRAHLTLARLGAPEPALPAVLQEGASVCPPPFHVADVVLVQSVLQPSGAVHTILERFPLEG
jgi:2'-5' RNA ligase